MNSFLRKIINDPNISPAFAKSLNTEEDKNIYCYCGGVMRPMYDYARNTIRLVCEQCGKERKLFVDGLGENKNDF